MQNKNDYITILGTGNAHATRCYNTCFTLHGEKGVLLVDAGGGNGILTQLEKAGIRRKDISDLFVTHAHTDHLLGCVWITTKERQFGFTAQLSGGRRLCCLGDEPFSPQCRQYVGCADWLMSEAFCLYEDRDRFQPYEKHHSTVLDAARLAEELQVKNLILYHTEDRTLDTRHERYTMEAKTVFKGQVFVPDDLERISLP